MPLILRKTIAQTFIDRVKSTPHQIGFQYKEPAKDQSFSSPWIKKTFQEFFDECKQISNGLIGLGVQPGDKVALLSQTRYEWQLCDMAIMGAQGIPVPIFAAQTPKEMTYVIENSDAAFLILEDNLQLQKYIDQVQENPSAFLKLKKVIAIQPETMFLVAKHMEVCKGVMTLQALKEIGRREEAKNSTRFEWNLISAKAEDCFTLCYTSGASGVQKGVVLTHDSLMSVLEDSVSVLKEFLESEKEVVLSHLPFAHIFGRIESLGGYVFGWKQVFAVPSERLTTQLKEIKPTLLFSVPRVFEKIQRQILDHSQSKTSRWALRQAERYDSTSFRKTVKYQIAKNLYLNALAKIFGGRLKFAICGGAPLLKEVGEFFEHLGVLILEGYGLTETCAPIAMNLPRQLRFGTVGKPLPEVAIKIDQDGEILIQSRKVFKSYYKMPEETEASFGPSSWFHTGDIGLIDQQGFIQITDRKKDLIVTNGGKKTAPQKIEKRARVNPWVTGFVVIGEGRDYLTALMSLDREQTISYANQQQILFSEYSELIKNPKILSVAQKIVEEVNLELASYERIKKFVILAQDLEISKSELTPSYKLKRGRINELYQVAIEQMYGDSIRVPLDSL